MNSKKVKEQTGVLDTQVVSKDLKHFMDTHIHNIKNRAKKIREALSPKTPADTLLFAEGQLYELDAMADDLTFIYMKMQEHKKI